MTMRLGTILHDDLGGARCDSDDAPDCLAEGALPAGSHRHDPRLERVKAGLEEAHLNAAAKLSRRKRGTKRRVLPAPNARSFGPAAAVGRASTPGRSGDCRSLRLAAALGHGDSRVEECNAKDQDAWQRPTSFFTQTGTPAGCVRYAALPPPLKRSMRPPKPAPPTGKPASCLPATRNLAHEPSCLG
jgi:hypothetical protein